MTRRIGQRIAVCVPIRDEAGLLPRFLDALSAQTGAHRFILCALLDGCSDDSAGIVRSYAASAPFAIVAATAASTDANAGRARRLAMELGLEQLSGDHSVILSTDADSRPDRDWLSANLAALERSDVAAGRIVRDAEGVSPLQDRIEDYYDALFRLRRSIDPVAWEAPDTHHYTSGASLAFRVGAYRALGGFEPLPAAEDARLIDAAHRAGLRVRRDAAIRVETSARRVGRAAGGLADHLRRLDDGETATTMAHPEDMAWRYRRQAAARAAWPDPSARAALATALCCEGERIERVAAASVNAEAFAMQVVPEFPGGKRIVPLEVAEAALEGMSRTRRRVAA